MNVDEQKTRARQILIDNGAIASIQTLGKDRLRDMIIDCFVEMTILKSELETLKNHKIILPN